MKRLLLALCLSLIALPAFAQSAPVLLPSGCGTGNITNSIPYTTVNSLGQFCITGSISASLSGFAPLTQGTPVSATVGGNTQTLPAGAVVVATNVGATNAAYCKLGAASDTGAQYIAPNGGWFAFTVGVATQLTCVTSSSTTTVNQVGGSGLATGTGGGGGSGGGAVTIADGADVTQGAVADAAYAGSGNATAISALKGIYNVINGPIPAGAQVIGKVGIDQTTPGTTNGISVVGVNGATALAGNGATGTGSPRITIANDNTIPTGWPTAANQTATQPRSPAAATTGGGSSYYVQPTASDNHVVIKNGAGTAYSVHFTNNSATKNYMRLYDAGTGFNGCNSATGIIFGVEIPPTDGGISMPLGGSVGLAFATGLSICVTSGYGSTDTTNATASAMMGNVIYK